RFSAPTFVDGLDPEYAKLLEKYDDISDYKNITIGEIMKRLSRSVRLGGRKGKISQDSGSARKNKKPLEERISSDSKPRFKSEKKAVADLTEDQRRRLERLIQKGGGEYVGEFRKNSDWRRMATDAGVCWTCA